MLLESELPWVDDLSPIKKAVDFTASTTGGTIWTPATGKIFVITDYEITFSGAGLITIFDQTDDTTNRVCKWNGAVSGGVVHAFRKPFKSSTVNNVLKYTTGAGCVGSLIFYGYEAAS